MIRTVTPQEAKAALHDGSEVALLDLREPGPFSMGHPLFAVPCPYCSLELSVGALVPRRSARILVIDGDDEIAEVAAEALARMGYTDVSMVAGGTPAWEAAGFTLYKGVNVPSKTLGELAEHLWHPKTIDAATMARWKDEGREFSLFDCRPPGEYARMTVPGAVCLPNGEIAHRLPTIGDGTPVVLTCAGRTRGIIGALSLRRVVPDREIIALENGTQGWALAGFDLSRGNTPGALPELDAPAASVTRDRAQALLKEEGLPVATTKEVAAFVADAERTTFLIDVRSGPEAERDPLPGFVHALSGQLVQATDQWIGVRHSRVILADDLGLRAGLAAWWLRMLGFEPHVVLIDDRLRGLAPPCRPEVPTSAVPTVPADAALGSVRDGGGRFVDLRGSEAYRRGHVAGAVWSVRPELDRISPERGMAIYLIGAGDGRERLAAVDLLRQGHPTVAIVEGGMATLRTLGATVEVTPDEPDPLQSPDITWFAHGRHDGDLDASRLYLQWEQGLVDQLDLEERASFAI